LEIELEDLAAARGDCETQWHGSHLQARVGKLIITAASTGAAWILEAQPNPSRFAEREGMRQAPGELEGYLLPVCAAQMQVSGERGNHCNRRADGDQNDRELREAREFQREQ
jgi:hypothetical protein